MVNTVAVVMATVEAPPVSECCEKLPSGEVTVQLAAPDDVQNIDVRAPIETVFGDAQMSTTGGLFPMGDAGLIFVVVCTGCIGLCVMVTCD